MEYPDWLPQLEKMTEYGNNWDFYVNAIYEIYLDDFIRNKIVYNSKQISVRRLPYHNGKDKTFWHIIQEVPDAAYNSRKNEDDRIPNLRRCERIRWPKAVISHYQDNFVKIWNYQKRKIKGSQERTYLWFNNEYLVILEERKTYVLFITAYPTDRTHTKRKLEKEFIEANKKADVAGATSETPSTHGR